MGELNQQEGNSIITHSRFAGLATSMSQNSKALPPGPNSAAPNYALEWNDWIINKDTGLLESRPGVSDVTGTIKEYPYNISIINSYLYTDTKNNSFLVVVDNLGSITILNLVKSNFLNNVYIHNSNRLHKVMSINQVPSPELRVNISNSPGFIPTNFWDNYVNAQSFGDLVTPSFSNSPYDLDVTDINSNLTNYNSHLFNKFSANKGLAFNYTAKIDNYSFVYNNYLNLGSVSVSPNYIKTAQFAELNKKLYIMLDNIKLMTFDGEVLYETYITPSSLYKADFNSQEHINNALMSSYKSWDYSSPLTPTSDFGFEDDLIKLVDHSDASNSKLCYIPLTINNTSFQIIPGTNYHGIIIKKPPHIDRALQENPNYKFLGMHFATSIIRVYDNKQSDVTSKLNTEGLIGNNTKNYPINYNSYMSAAIDPTDSPNSIGFTTNLLPIYNSPTIIDEVSHISYITFDNNLTTTSKIGQYYSFTKEYIPDGLGYPINKIINSNPWIIDELRNIDTNNIGKVYYFKAFLKIDRFRVNTPSTIPSAPLNIQEGYSELVPVLFKLKINIIDSTSVSVDMSDGIDMMYLPFYGSNYTGIFEHFDSLDQIITDNDKINYGYSYISQLSIVWDKTSTNSGLSTHAVKVYSDINYYETEQECLDNKEISDLSGLFLTDIIPINPYNGDSGLGFNNNNKSSLNFSFYPIIPPESKGPSTILDQQQYTQDALRDVKQVGPVGSIMESFKGRLYISGDKENPNNVYVSDAVYGPEMPPVGWGDSYVIDSTNPVTAIAGLYSSIAFFTGKELFLLSGDFPSNTLRLDQMADHTFGCIGPNALCKVNDKLFWLSDEGYCSMNMGNYQFDFLGAMPRINSSDSLYDDHKELHKLQYIPKLNYIISCPFNSNSSEKITAYCLHNNSFQTFSISIKANLGVFEIPGTTINLLINNNGSFESSNWSNFEIKKINDSGSLLDYFDYADIGGSPIDLKYRSDFIGSLNPSINKKLNHIAVDFSYVGQTNQDLSIINNITGDIIVGINYDNSQMQTVLNPDYREDLIHSKHRYKVNKRELKKLLKGISAKVQTISYSLETYSLGNYTYTSNCNPKIQSISLEFTPIYKRKEARWIRGGRGR